MLRSDRQRLQTTICVANERHDARSTVAADSTFALRFDKRAMLLFF